MFLNEEKKYRARKCHSENWKIIFLPFADLTFGFTKSARRFRKIMTNMYIYIQI